jgi:hypothetical protein
MFYMAGNYGNNAGITYFQAVLLVSASRYSYLLRISDGYYLKKQLIFYTALAIARAFFIGRITACV